MIPYAYWDLWDDTFEEYYWYLWEVDRGNTGS